MEGTDKAVSMVFSEDEKDLNVKSAPLGEQFDRKIFDVGTRDRTLPFTRGVDEIYKREWLIFLCIIGCLTACVTVHHMTLWEWFAFILISSSGLLVGKWLMYCVVLLIELEILCFYFVLEKIFEICIWLWLPSLFWFRDGVDDHSRNIILGFITWTIASLLIGLLLWLLKNLLLGILSFSFHVNTYFHRIQKSIFNQYVLLILSGPPGRNKSNASQLYFRVTNKDEEGKENMEKDVIDISKVHEMKQEEVSVYKMKMLVTLAYKSVVISDVLDENTYSKGHGQTHKKITNEEEAIAAAHYIFRNVGQPCCKYIGEYDLTRFMIKEEVDIVFPIIDVGESGQIDRKTLTEWVVKVHKDRIALAHALTNTSSVLKQLNTHITALLIVIIIDVWLLLMCITTTKVLVALSLQLVVGVFMFRNTCKTIFKAIIFVFVMHPFDVGDSCVVDGVKLIVEDMNIFTTVFLKANNEKVYYSNAILALKPISNFCRSPHMGDSVEFLIYFNTPMKKIRSLKEKIKKFLEENPHHWHPNHRVVKEIENVKKNIKMALFFNHTMNFQTFAEKRKRRTGLVLEMKRILEELNIRYDILPQEVGLTELKTSTEASR